MSKLKLYGGPRTRSAIVEWYLAELGIDYELIALDLSANEQNKPEFLAINPFGKVPAIVQRLAFGEIADNDFNLWESGAILIYLAEKYAGETSLEEKAIITQWVIFANATLALGLFLEDRREKEMPRLLTPLEEILSKQPYLTGEKLTAADIAVGAYLHYAKFMVPLDYSNYSAIQAYLDRLSSTEAFKNTLGKR